MVVLLQEGVVLTLFIHYFIRAAIKKSPYKGEMSKKKGEFGVGQGVGGDQHQ